MLAHYSRHATERRRGPWSFKSTYAEACIIYIIILSFRGGHGNGLFFFSFCMKSRKLFLHPLPFPPAFFTLPLVRKCCWKFLHLFVVLPPTPVLSLYLTYPRSSTLSYPLQPPCCSVHQAVCTSVYPALAIVKIWPKKKCVHGEEDKDRRLWKKEEKR